MAYTDITDRDSPNYTPGRSGRNISGITIHWWGDPGQNPQAENVVNWLCNPASQVSAHYVATGTGRRVWCLVDCSNTAWHAGNWEGNCSTIGIECDPRCQDEDYDVVAELIADIWKVYGKLPLYPHRHWFNTACPGSYDLGRLQSLAEQKFNGVKPEPKPKPTATMTKLAQPLELKTKIDANLWDLDSYPNWRSVKTIAKDTKFIAYAEANWANAKYYITEYSFKKGVRNGVNALDLEQFADRPKDDEKLQNPPKNEDKKTTNNSSLEEIANVAKSNNRLLTQILELLKGLIAKIAGIFK